MFFFCLSFFDHHGGHDNNDDDDDKKMTTTEVVISELDNSINFFCLFFFLIHSFVFCRCCWCCCCLYRNIRNNNNNKKWPMDTSVNDGDGALCMIDSYFIYRIFIQIEFLFSLCPFLSFKQNRFKHHQMPCINFSLHINPLIFLKVQVFRFFSYRILYRQFLNSVIKSELVF